MKKATRITRRLVTGGVCTAVTVSVLANRDYILSNPKFGSLLLCQDVGSRAVIPLTVSRAGLPLNPACCIEDMGPDGRGMICRTRGINAGSILVHVPRGMLLTADNIESNETDSHVFNALRSAGLDDRGVLALWLLIESVEGEKSDWYTYLKGLPTEIDLMQRHLLFCDERLEGSALQSAIDEMRQNISRQIRVILRTLDELGIDTPIKGLPQSVLEERWKWAHAIVLSRSGLVKEESSSPSEWTKLPVCIIPLVDFVNHSDTPNAHVRINADGSVDLVSVRDIKEGEEIRISYWPDSPISSEQSLFSFGFPSGFDRFALPGINLSGDAGPRNAIQRLLYLDNASNTSDNNIYLADIQAAVTHFAIESMNDAAVQKLATYYVRERGLGEDARRVLHEYENAGRLKVIHKLIQWRSILEKNQGLKHPILLDYLHGLLKGIDGALSNLTEEQ
jgi:hypothetical protein